MIVMMTRLTLMLFDALFVAGAVIVTNDGHERIREAEAGHEHKALQLEVYAPAPTRRFRKGDQDFVHAEVHHAADALHDDAGQAHIVDAPHSWAGRISGRAECSRTSVLYLRFSTKHTMQPSAQHGGNGAPARPCRVRPAGRR